MCDEGVYRGDCDLDWDVDVACVGCGLLAAQGINYLLPYCVVPDVVYCYMFYTRYVGSLFYCCCHSGSNQPDGMANHLQWGSQACTPSASEQGPPPTLKYSRSCPRPEPVLDTLQSTATSNRPFSIPPCVLHRRIIPLPITLPITDRSRSRRFLRKVLTRHTRIGRRHRSLHSRPKCSREWRSGYRSVVPAWRLVCGIEWRG